MDRAVSFTDYIQPICFPSSIVSIFHMKGYVVGYGKMNIETGENSATPKQVEMYSVDPAECYSSNHDSTIAVSKSSFCAKGNLSTPCDGRFLIAPHLA